jgi:hypothetical protein
LIDLIAGHRVTAVIYVAAKLGIPDLLAEQPRTAAELAQLTDTHERSFVAADARAGRSAFAPKEMTVTSSSPGWKPIWLPSRSAR